MSGEVECSPVVFREPVDRCGYVTAELMCSTCDETVFKAGAGNETGKRYADWMARKLWREHVLENAP